MPSSDTDPRVPALQLLLANTTDEEKRALFYGAFPDTFILYKGDARITKNRLHDARTALKGVVATCDGSSPLGIVAVNQIAKAAEYAGNQIGITLGVLGLST